jgi:phage terminase large subunit-like protein
VSDHDLERKKQILKLLELRELRKKDRVLESIDLSLIQREFVLCGAKTAAIIGANRSGKSEALGVDVNCRATGVIPDCIKDVYPKDFIRFGEYWISALTYKTSHGITQKKIKKFLPKRHDGGFNKEFKLQRVVVSEGKESEIGFMSADSGSDKYQGESKVYVGHDEEPPKDVRDEAYIRTTDCSGIERFAFTPLKGLTWAYKEIYLKAHKYIYTRNKHGIPEEIGVVHTPEEIELLKDRELVVQMNSSSEADPDIVIFQMTIYDNKHLPGIEVQRAEKKYKSDPAQYNARILGHFTKMNGRNVFNVNILQTRQRHLPSTFLRGNLVNGQWQPQMEGNLVLFKERKPVGKGFYVIGGDVAEGLEIGDFSCAQILDHSTCEQVGIWHGHCSPEEFARILVELGTWFNYAYVAPEINFHGFGVVNRIKDHFKYPRLFSEYDIAAQTVKGNAAGSLVKRYGWHTNAKTKPIMVQELAQHISEGHLKINDHATIDELITFVYDKDGHTNAMGGCYDDRAVALAIALQVFKRKSIPRFETVQAPQSDRLINPITGYPCA